MSYDIIKKVIRPSGIYMGTNIFNRAISFLMLPILTRFLSPFQYGILATFQAVYPMGESFIDMGSTAAVSRLYFDERTSASNFAQYIFNSIIVKLSFLILFLVMLLSFRSWIIEKFKFPLWLIIMVAGIALASAFIGTMVRLLVVQRKVYAYSLFQSSRSIVNVILSLLLVVAIGLSWRGRIFGIAITETIFMLFALIFLIKRYLLRIAVRPNLIKEILIFGMPLFVYGIGRWIITLADRFFLNVMLDVSVTGIYSVGYSVGSLVEFIAGGVGFAVMPILFEKLKSPTEIQKRTIVKYTYLYFSVLFLITLIWIFIAPYFLRVFVGESFVGALRYIPWISFAYFANAMFRIFSLYIAYSKKTYYLIYSIMAAAFVNLALNYILIKANGSVGAAQATLISYLLNLALAWFFAQRAYPMPWFGRA